MEYWSNCNEACNWASWAQIRSNQPWPGIFGIIQNPWRIWVRCNYRSCSQLHHLPPRIFLEFFSTSRNLFWAIFVQECFYFGKSLPPDPTCRSLLSTPRPTCWSLRSTWHHEHARANKVAPRSGRAGPDATVALSDTASRLASPAGLDSPGPSLSRLATVPPGRSEAAARLHGLDAVIALAATRVIRCAAVSSRRAIC
jgi:hypothetical protein